jgi:hypothetical protein
MLSLPLIGRTGIGQLNFWQCPYKHHTGRDCPFCGLTRDLEEFASMRWSHIRNRNGVFFMIGFVLELGWRIALIRLRTPSVLVWRVDILAHIVAGGVLTLHLLTWAHQEPWFPGLIP